MTGAVVSCGCFALQIMNAGDLNLYQVTLVGIKVGKCCFAIYKSCGDTSTVTNTVYGQQFGVCIGFYGYS